MFCEPTVTCVQLMEETGNGRDINRHFYSMDEASDALDKPVVKALLDLCRFRNLHPAFGGEVKHLSPLPLTGSWLSISLVGHHASGDAGRIQTPASVCPSMAICSGG